MIMESDIYNENQLQNFNQQFQNKGYVQVFNNGGFYASFNVSYVYEGQIFTRSTNSFPYQSSQTIYFPEEATSINVTIQIAVFIGIWKTVYNKDFSKNNQLCFMVYGTTLAPSVKQMSCTNSPEVGDPIPPTSCCCQCCQQCCQQCSGNGNGNGNNSNSCTCNGCSSCSMDDEANDSNSYSPCSMSNESNSCNDMYY